MNRFLPAACVLAVAVPAAARADSYFGVAGVLGDVDALQSTSFAVEGGNHYDSGVGLHGAASIGGLHAGFLEHFDGSGSVAQLRGGLEGRACSKQRRLCGLLGVDAGVEHVVYDGTITGDLVFFGPPPSMYVHRDDVSALGVLRAGLDVGSAVRFRPGLEVAVDDHGATLGLSLGGAYQW